MVDKWRGFAKHWALELRCSPKRQAPAPPPGVLEGPISDGPNRYCQLCFKFGCTHLVTVLRASKENRIFVIVPTSTQQGVDSSTLVTS